MIYRSKQENFGAKKTLNLILSLLLFDVKTIPDFLSYDLHTYTKKFVFSVGFFYDLCEVIKTRKLSSAR